MNGMHPWRSPRVFYTVQESGSCTIERLHTTKPFETKISSSSRIEDIFDFENIGT